MGLVLDDILVMVPNEAKVIVVASAYTFTSQVDPRWSMADTGLLYCLFLTPWEIVLFQDKLINFIPQLAGTK